MTNIDVNRPQPHKELPPLSKGKENLPCAQPTPVENATNELAVHTLGTTQKTENRSTVYKPQNSIPSSAKAPTEGIEQESTLISVNSRVQKADAVSQTGKQWDSPSKAISLEDFELISHKWVGVYQEDLMQDWTHDELCRLIQKRRAEIKDVKDNFLQKQRTPSTERALHVKELMETGTLKPVKEGKSGVYFLCDQENKPLYVVKPYDEDMCALNNSKGFALPFNNSDGYGGPKPGIPLYSALLNEELAGQVALQLGISRCTAASELMVLESDVFTDITDGINAQIQDIEEALGFPDKEKLCIVQDFIPDCQEIGDIILSGANKTKEEYMRMSEDERNELERGVCPSDINHEMYEEAVILAAICGEVDGNPGNWMVGKEVNPNTGLRDFYKIDNAAAFPEDSSSLQVGEAWIINNAEKPLTEHGRNLIRRLDEKGLIDLMRSRGASDKSIEALSLRVGLMKWIEPQVPEATAQEFIDYLTNYLAQMSQK